MGSSGALPGTLHKTAFPAAPSPPAGLLGCEVLCCPTSPSVQSVCHPPLCLHAPEHTPTWQHVCSITSSGCEPHPHPLVPNTTTPCAPVPASLPCNPCCMRVGDGHEQRSWFGQGCSRSSTCSFSSRRPRVREEANAGPGQSHAAPRARLRARLIAGRGFWRRHTPRTEAPLVGRVRGTLCGS